MKEEERAALRTALVGDLQDGVLRHRWGTLLLPSFVAPTILAWIIIFNFVHVPIETSTSFGIALALCFSWVYVLRKFIPRKVNIVTGILIVGAVGGYLLLMILGWFWSLLTLPFLWYSFKSIPANCNHPDFYTLSEEENVEIAAMQTSLREKRKAQQAAAKDSLVRIEMMSRDGDSSNQWLCFTQGSNWGEQSIRVEMQRAQNAHPTLQIRAVNGHGRLLDML